MPLLREKLKSKRFREDLYIWPADSFTDIHIHCYFKNNAFKLFMGIL